MTSVLSHDNIRFQVMVNREKQHSIWPEYKGIP